MGIGCCTNTLYTLIVVYPVAREIIFLVSNVHAKWTYRDAKVDPTVVIRSKTSSRNPANRERPRENAEQCDHSSASI